MARRFRRRGSFRRSFNRVRTVFVNRRSRRRSRRRSGGGGGSFLKKRYFGIPLFILLIAGYFGFKRDGFIVKSEMWKKLMNKA